MEPTDAGRCSRRDFLKAAALSTAAIAIDARFAQAGETMKPTSSNQPVLPRRPYGRNGIQLSIIGMGGIVVMNAEQAHANRIVAEFVERGVNYFDVAPSYGNAEEKLGPALEPYRKDCFLACKTTQRTGTGAAAELQRSLATLRTDYFDLYQLHAVTDVGKDIDTVFTKGGAMETFIAAKKSGQVRHLGFSAHSVEAALTAMDRYDFDSILFPVNFANYHVGNFGPQMMARAQDKGLSRLALKAVARLEEPQDRQERKEFPPHWSNKLFRAHGGVGGPRGVCTQAVTAGLTAAHEEPFLRAAPSAATGPGHADAGQQCNRRHDSGRFDER